MTDIIPKDPLEWCEVTQIEPDDFVVADGERGINRQLTELATRDAKLKADTEELRRLTRLNGNTILSLQENKANKTDIADYLHHATLERRGIVQLSNATDSNDETKAATPKAVHLVHNAIDALQRELQNKSTNSALSTQVRYLEDKIREQISLNNGQLERDWLTKQAELDRFKQTIERGQRNFAQSSTVFQMGGDVQALTQRVAALERRLNQERQVGMLSGVIRHGELIPLPNGFTQAQCRWIVTPGYIYDDTSGGDILFFETSADGNRRVRCLVEGKQSSRSWAQYLIFGIK